jgi:hypothetical protein
VTDNEDFFSFIAPSNLYLAASVLTLFTVSFVVLIFINLSSRKRRYLSCQKITSELNNWMSEILVEECEFQADVSLILQQYLDRPYHRQFVVDCLINLKKSITGTSAAQIVAMYEKIGLKNDSIKKLRSSRTFYKCRGIFELYMMRQYDMMPEIARFTDSRNELVRMEAQTATVGFNGFKGLYFLTGLIHPLTDWQQLKLLEQLNKLPPEDLPDLPGWLRSPNNYVVRFALKLTDIYQHYQVRTLVADCLKSDDMRVRCLAITTLARIADEDTASILIDHYAGETSPNKGNILRQLAVIGTDTDIPFLVLQLAGDDDTLKLEASRAITLCCAGGWHVLQGYAAKSETINSIAQQIKYELAL